MRWKKIYLLVVQCNLFSNQKDLLFNRFVVYLPVVKIVNGWEKLQKLVNSCCWFTECGKKMNISLGHICRNSNLLTFLVILLIVSLSLMGHHCGFFVLFLSWTV